MSNIETTAPSNLPAHAPTTGNFLSVIADAARDPQVDVAKMEGLLRIQTQLMDRAALEEFNRDFALLQARLPRIKKDGKISHQNNKVIATYATFERIDDVIRPIMAEFGFALRFNTEPADGKVIVTGILSHRGGHSEVGKFQAGVDASGAKNNVQGVASTITYGKRQITSMMLNLVFEGEDDDANTADHVAIDHKQAQEIRDLMRIKGKTEAGVLTFAGAPTIEEISVAKYAAVIRALQNAPDKV